VDWRRWLLSGFGIDLGTANTVVCHPRRGIVLNEPSVMVLHANGDGQPRPVFVGQPAKDLIGRTARGMVTVRPLQDGVITDLQTARTFIVAILRKVARRPWERIRPTAVIGVPAGATALERRALVEAAEEAGFGRVSLLPEPIAGALGSGLDPLLPRAQMVVDVGGGTAEVTAFCYGGLLTSRSSRIAGDEMTGVVFQYLRQAHQLLVGELAAEQLKMKLSNGHAGPLLIHGRDIASDRPRELTLVADEVSEALRPTVDGIIQALAVCLEDLSAQAVDDIMQDGVLAFGGGSLLRGFAQRLEEAFGFKVRVAEHPLTCVARGAAAGLLRPAVVKAYGSD